MQFSVFEPGGNTNGYFSIPSFHSERPFNSLFTQVPGTKKYLSEITALDPKLSMY